MPQYLTAKILEKEVLEQIGITQGAAVEHAGQFVGIISQADVYYKIRFIGGGEAWVNKNLMERFCY